MNELRIAKYGQCNNYSIFIASRFFDNLQDYINLEMGVKRFRGNLDKFFYNPILLTEETMKFFPNVKTLHVYNESDPLLEGGRIQWYCIWYEVDCTQSLEMKEKYGNDKFECKRLTYSKMITTTTWRK